MKKRLLFIALTLLFITNEGFSQYKGAHAITYKFLGIDTYSPYANVKDNGDLGFKFSGREAFDNMQLGVEVGYFYGVTDWLAIGLPLRMGRIQSRRDSVTTNNFSNDLFASLDARARISAFFKEKQFIIPYLTTGVGGMLKEGKDFDVQLPVGMGLNIRLARNFYAALQTEFRFSFDEIKDKDVTSFTNNMHHSIGFLFQLGNRDEPVEEPPVIEEPEPVDTDGDGIVDEDDDCPEDAGLAKFNGCPDTDEDGIVDADDSCPEVAGIEAFNGCPDTDSDGIADNEDSCPEEAGPASNDGCPLKDRDNDGVNDADDECPDTPGAEEFAGCPDTDGDGVPDKSDKCASTPGLAAFNGCPDSDGDGVADKDDKCPSTKGTVANNGCPEIKEADKATLNFATQAIEFETGSAVIRKSSYATLDKVADVLQRNPAYHVSIGGHTDSVGDANNNLKLSEKRAKACLEYLATKGVSRSRMSSTGYGETQPIADNGTKEGRQRNRRVEFVVFLR